MGKPRMIILIRHAQSEGNKNREIHQSVPDHRVKLTPEGHKQALEAGRKLRALLRPDDTIHFFTSPYRRTRETTEGILTSLTSDDPSPSPFPRHTIKVYEEPRLREQDFGNFQPCSAEMERMWQERADYGHFFYRIPDGESAADAYDRVSGFNESLWRLFGEDDFASVCVLVTHGLMTRVFLMKWYHFSVEYFEDLRNVNHCEFVIMEKNPDNGKYILQNKLRTWSDLRKEKELENKREAAAKGYSELTATLPSDSPIPTQRKWGGCPDGCNHGIGRPKAWRPARRDTADLFRDDDGGETSDGPHRRTSSVDGTADLPRGNVIATKVVGHARPRANLSIVTHRPESIDEIISSPDQTPSYISLAALTAPRGSSPLPVFVTNAHDRLMPTERGLRPFRDSQASVSSLRLSSSDDDDNKGNRPAGSDPGVSLLRLGGRDGGGSNSGVNSLAPSDNDESDSPLPEGAPHRVPSQEAEHDGDDEGSGTRRPLRRSKQHNHHHHYHHHYNNNSTTHRPTGIGKPPPGGHRMANVLGDGDDNEYGNVDADDDEIDNGTASPGGRNRDSFELEREKEESVRGCIY